MADPTASISAFMAGWFTPSSLFIVVNLVIGTIAITSRLGASKRHIHQEPHLVRSPSLLERVKSFNLGPYNNQPAFAETQFAQPQLVRTPSLLERVKSFNFSLYNYEPITVTPSPAETEYPQPEQESPYPNPNPNNPPQPQLHSMNFSRLYRSDSAHGGKELGIEDPSESYPNADNPPQPQLDRAPSFLERLQSINFSRLRRRDSDPGHDSGKGGEDLAEGSKPEMRKSASDKSGSVKWEEDEARVERRWPETARAETTSHREDDEVDAKADDFINRFKKQLRLQRMDSILRYREMVRGN